MRRLLRFLGFHSLFASASKSAAAKVRRINARRVELAKSSDDALEAAGQQAENLTEDIAVTAEVARRTIGLDMFDVQIQGALALADGKIAEMQTGEGKTLAGVPAIVWHAKQGHGVHVMTVNDYLARRDAHWMGPIYNLPWTYSGVHSTKHVGRATPSGLRLRHHLRHRERNWFRLPAGPTRTAALRAGPATIHRGCYRRSRFHPHRRSAHSPGNCRREERAGYAGLSG